MEILHSVNLENGVGMDISKSHLLTLHLKLYIFHKEGSRALIISLGWSISDHENDICCRGHLGDEK